ncbi:MAG: ABC transporter ATP-binding protein [Oscillospiraceae bacterium]
MENIIEINDVCFSYNLNKPNQVNALQGINLSISKGKKYAIIGPSGSGKTTLLSIMGGLLRPTSGKYYFNGIDMINITEKQLANIRNQLMGFVLQDFGLLSDRSALDNVSVPLLLSKIKFKDIKQNAIDAMRKVGVENLANKYVQQLSGGEAQRVAIARGLVLSPLILFADEPTGALDSTNSEKVMELFDKRAKENLTIVMVTHNIELAKKCDVILAITDGSLMKKGG